MPGKTKSAAKKSEGGCYPTDPALLSEVEAILSTTIGISICAAIRNDSHVETFEALLKSLMLYAQLIFEDESVHEVLCAIMQSLGVLMADNKATLLDEHSTSTLVTATRRLLFYGTELAPRAVTDNPTNIDVELRTQAMQLLSFAVRSNHRSFISQWVHLLPDHGATAQRPFTPTLFTSLLFDPAAKVRSAANYAVTVLLEDSRPYLQQADDKKPGSASFTAYSVRLGCMMKEMHLGLSHATSATFPTSIHLERVRVGSGAF